MSKKPLFAKRHYEAIAEHVHCECKKVSEEGGDSDSYGKALSSMIYQLAVFFKKDNPQFDHQRFLDRVFDHDKEQT